MIMKAIKDLSIAKNVYFYNKDIKEIVSYNKWVDFIDQNADFFTWLEDTEQGKKTLENISSIPESFRSGILKGHNKSRAFGEFNIKKGYYEMYVDYHEQSGKITTTFQKPIKKAHIKLLQEMAVHCEALLLNNGTEIITLETINKKFPGTEV